MNQPQERYSTHFYIESEGEFLHNYDANARTGGVNGYFGEFCDDSLKFEKWCDANYLLELMQATDKRNSRSCTYTIVER